jgi:MFS superfamily sulfate permease-like transporter
LPPLDPPMPQPKVQEDGSSSAGFLAPWIQNFGPAVVVILISIPLSMGIAIASGVPPARGLVTAVIGGLVIGSLSGSQLQISGPSAGLAVMILDLVNRHGLKALGVVVPLMGLIQAGAGLLKLGQLFRAVSPAVINAMLAGIGILILAAQFHVMVDDVPKGSGLENLSSIPSAVMHGIFPIDGSVHEQAALIGILTLAVLVGMSFIKKGPLRKVPAPLAAVIIATLATVTFGLGVRRVDMPDTIWDAIVGPTSADLSLLGSPSLIFAALALSLVASAETLLCSSAVDGMHDGPRTNYDRELFAQGVGNFFCGLCGAPPTTGVITRSTANVQAGAKGRQSAVLVGAGMLAFLVAFPTVLEVIPRSCLAAILVYIGYKLVRHRPYAELRSYGKSELVIYLVTVAVIVGVDLLTGISVGIGLALGKLAFSHGRDFHKLIIRVSHDDANERVDVTLSGAASFIRLPKLAATLEAMPAGREVHLHVDELEYIDHACLDIITKWERQRILSRSPVRVEWNRLQYTYHAGNRLDETPEQFTAVPDQSQCLLDFLTTEVILINPSFDSKEHAIERMGRALARRHGLGIDGDAFIDSVERREAQASTCLGGGLMVPHGVTTSRHSLLGVMAVSDVGWSFDTPDGEPVRCIVLLATPKKAAAHHLAVLAALARLFLLSPELKERLVTSSSPNEVRDVLGSEEARELNYAFERVASAPSQGR